MRPLRGTPFRSLGTPQVVDCWILTFLSRDHLTIHWRWQSHLKYSDWKSLKPKITKIQNAVAFRKVFFCLHVYSCRSCSSTGKFKLTSTACQPEFSHKATNLQLKYYINNVLMCPNLLFFSLFFAKTFRLWRGGEWQQKLCSMF